MTNPALTVFGRNSGNTDEAGFSSKFACCMVPMKHEYLYFYEWFLENEVAQIFEILPDGG